jgi:hypothetical protein
MILHRRLPYRLQLAGLGWNAADRASGDYESELPVFVDVNGNPVPPPVVVNPLTGETSIDPSVMILRSRVNQGSLENEGTSYDNSAFESLPGVQNGVIPSNSYASVVVTPRDLMPTGIISSVPVQRGAPPAPPGSPDYIGPARPASLPLPVNTPTQTFFPAPAPVPAVVTAPAPIASHAPAPVTSHGGAVPLPSWAPITSTITTSSAGGGVDAGPPAAPASSTAPTPSSSVGLAALAAIAFLFAN